MVEEVFDANQARELSLKNKKYSFVDDMLFQSILKKIKESAEAGLSKAELTYDEFWKYFSNLGELGYKTFTVPGIGNIPPEYFVIW